MATFKPEVRMDNLRSDNTYSIRIRITHNRKVKRIPTSIYVDKKEVTKSGKIKNQQIIDKLEDIVREYRKKVTALSVAIEVMTIDELTERLKTQDKQLVLIGDGANVCYKKMKDVLENISIVSSTIRYQSASSVALIAEELILKGKVRVNGEVIKELAKVILPFLPIYSTFNN